MSEHHGWAVVRYGVAWLAAGVVLAAGVLIAVRSVTDSQHEARRDVVTGAGTPCVERRDAGPADRAAVRVMQPPTFGPPAQPARAGTYVRSPRPEALVGALRRGVVVVQYQPRLRRHLVERIEREFGEAQHETVITPDATGMRYAIAVTAWRRMLGCSSLDSNAVRAASEFTRRYAGSGPDAGP